MYVLVKVKIMTNNSNNEIIIITIITIDQELDK